MFNLRRSTLLVVIVLLFPPFLCAQNFKTFKYNSKEDLKNIPLGVTCYDYTSQMLLDDALRSAVSYKVDLGECRQWRDYYRKQVFGVPAEAPQIIATPSDEAPGKGAFILVGFIAGIIFGGIIY